MIEKGMGRTRLGRFAAITVPATVATAGLGFAMLQGMVGAALASSSSFQVTGSRATGDALELTANYVSTAASETSAATTANSQDALVSLKNGVVTDLCLAADTSMPVLSGTVGIKISASGPVSLGGGYTDLAADSLTGAGATLGQTKIGYAQVDLVHQKTATSPGYAEGGFSLATTEAVGAVDIDGLDANVYALTLNGLTLSNLSIAPVLASVEGSC